MASLSFRDRTRDIRWFRFGVPNKRRQILVLGRSRRDRPASAKVNEIVDRGGYVFKWS